jgi:hypothetical protein
MKLKKWLIATAVAVLTVIIAYAAVYEAIAYLKKQDRVRIVRNGAGGALLAVDADGLRLLNEYYALPKTCTEKDVRGTIKILGCYPTLTHITDGMIKKGLVLIAERTRAEITAESYVFPDGRLVSNYSGTLFQCAKDGAVHVERIRITHPPHKNLEGWVAAHFLMNGGGPWP